MTEQDFIPKKYSNTVESGKVTWESPSNIALIKYWGKKKGQIPENPSISFTLNNCKTITSLTFSKKEVASNFEFDVYLRMILNQKSKLFLSVLKFMCLF